MMWHSIDPGVKYYAYAVWEDRALVATGMAFTSALSKEGCPAIIEKPQVYRNSLVRQGDIVDLAISAGRISAQYSHTSWVLPAAWKGQVPKAVHQRKIAKQISIDLSSWTKEELSHILDAIGLGLYAKEQGIYPWSITHD